MSWYGTHPRMTRAEARALLPPGACKLCVYWTRTRAELPEKPCSRCGCHRPPGRLVHVCKACAPPALEVKIWRSQDKACERCGKELAIGDTFYFWETTNAPEPREAWRMRSLRCVCWPCATSANKVWGTPLVERERDLPLTGHRKAACDSCKRAFADSEQAFHYWSKT